MKGTVLAVCDGNTVVVKYVDKKDLIEAVSLDNVSAPRLGFSDGSRIDEPWAWESFDFLRKLTIAKRVVVIPSKRNDKDNFRVHPNFGRLKVTFGRIELFDKDNMDVGMAVIESGWAKVRGERSDDDYAQILHGLQDGASQAKRGIWQEGEGHIRHLPCRFEDSDLLKKREFDGIIEAIPNGSTFNVWLLPNFEYVTVQLAGVRCPSAKRDLPDPFGPEAKHYVEVRLLQRGVKVTLAQASDRGGMFVGIIKHPQGGDIAPLLLREGLAEIFNPTIGLAPSGEDYRRAEIDAKKARKNKWRNFDTATLRSGRLEGKVITMRGSNSLGIDVGGGEIKYVFFSCTKTPLYNPTVGSEPLGFEAREFVRKMAIGQQATAIVDYTTETKDGEKRQCATIYVGDKCLNEELVAAGLAQVAFPRNVRTSDRIDAMLRHEADNKAKGVGVFAQKLPKAVAFNDLSNKPQRAKSVPFLHYIENKPEEGVIEYFSNSTRAVVLLEKQNAIIRMNMLGIIGVDVNERVGNQALQYMNEHYLLRKCEVNVRDVDKMGLFIGTISIPGRPVKSLELDLVEHGYADLHSSYTKHPQREALEEALEDAKDRMVGMWADTANLTLDLDLGKVYEVNVTAVWDPVTVVIQLQSDELARINQLLVQARQPVSNVMKGDLVAAIFERKIYRARVAEVRGKEVTVDFIELCVRDNVSISDLRKLPEELTKIPPQAISVRIGGCRAFGFDENFDKSAEDYVWALVEGKTLYAHLMFDDGVHEPQVLLTDRPSVDGGSVNSMILSKGYARLKYYELEEPMATIMQRLDEIEVAARAARVGAWVHGNIGDDDDEDYDE